MPTRVCLGCGGLTSSPSKRGYCPECQASYEQSRPARGVYDTARWRRVRRRVLHRHVTTNGWWCPGYKTPPHLSRDLTVDHGAPLAQGGDPYDEAQLHVLCRSCNGRKGAAPATR